MRRILTVVGVLLAVHLTLLFVRPSGAAAPPTGTGLNVGVVFDLGGRGDKSFNDGAYVGAMRAAEQLADVAKAASAAGRESWEQQRAARAEAERAGADATAVCYVETTGPDGVLWGALPLSFSDGTRIPYKRSASTSAGFFAVSSRRTCSSTPRGSAMRCR